MTEFAFCCMAATQAVTLELVQWIISNASRAGYRLVRGSELNQPTKNPANRVG